MSVPGKDRAFLTRSPRKRRAAVPATARALASLQSELWLVRSSALSGRRAGEFPDGLSGYFEGAAASNYNRDSLLPRPARNPPGRPGRLAGQVGHPAGKPYPRRRHDENTRSRSGGGPRPHDPVCRRGERTGAAHPADSIGRGNPKDRQRHSGRARSPRPG